MEKEGIKATYKSGTIHDGFCSLKFEFAEMGKDGAVTSKEAEEYKYSAHMLGLPKDGLGKEFSAGGKTYVVRGLLPRSRNCILAARKADGKLFKFSPTVAFPGHKENKIHPFHTHLPDLFPKNEEDDVNRSEARFS